MLKELFGAKIQLSNIFNTIKVSIAQFYGIEINDFAVAVVQTALWIAEMQMIQETQEIINHDLDSLPLKSYANIREGNALQLDRKTVAPDANFIIGNPPFVGERIMTAAQKSDLTKVCDGQKNVGNLNYVSGWFKKTADYMKDSPTRAAFASTNSICQGDSVGILWRALFDAGNINVYLLAAPNIFVESRPTPLQTDVPTIGIGNKPIDDGNYLFTLDEMKDFVVCESAAAKYFRPWYGAREFICPKFSPCKQKRGNSKACR